jgi:hypothetical protein
MTAEPSQTQAAPQPATETAPQPRTTRRVRLVIGIVGLIVVAVAAGYFALPGFKPKERTFTGKVLKIDYEHRTAVLEIFRKRSGTNFEMQVDIPAGVPLTIDGRPATLDELTVGDALDIEVLVTGRTTFEPRAVHVLRDATTRPAQLSGATSVEGAATGSSTTQPAPNE